MCRARLVLDVGRPGERAFDQATAVEGPGARWVAEEPPLMKAVHESGPFGDASVESTAATVSEESESRWSSLPSERRCSAEHPTIARDGGQGHHGDEGTDATAARVWPKVLGGAGDGYGVGRTG